MNEVVKVGAVLIYKAIEYEIAPACEFFMNELLHPCLFSKPHRTKQISGYV